VAKLVSLNKAGLIEWVRVEARAAPVGGATVDACDSQ